jgi:Ubiquitin carboxyl-terminal hydrolase
LDISRIIPAEALRWHYSRPPRQRETLELLFNICIGGSIGLAGHRVLGCGKFWNFEWSLGAGALAMTFLWNNEMGFRVSKMAPRYHYRLDKRDVDALDRLHSLDLAGHRQVQPARPTILPDVAALDLMSRAPANLPRAATFPKIPHLSEGSCWFAATLVALAPLLLLRQSREQLLPNQGPTECQQALKPLFERLCAREPIDHKEIEIGFQFLLKALSAHGDNREFTIQDPTEAFSLIIDQLGLTDQIGFAPIHQTTFTNRVSPLEMGEGTIETLNLGLETRSVIAGDPACMEEPFTFRYRDPTLPILPVTLDAVSLQEAVNQALAAEEPCERRCLAMYNNRYYLTEGEASNQLFIEQGPPILPIMVKRFNSEGLYCSKKLQAKRQLTLATEQEGEVQYLLAAFTCYGHGHHWAHVNWNHSWQKVDDMRSCNIDEGFNPSELDTGYFYLYVRQDVWKERTQPNKNIPMSAMI